MGTKNEPGRFDCYAQAEPDEPNLTLLARDLAAPLAVREWCAERVALGLNLEGDEQIVEARECADAMDAWRLEHRPERDTLEERRAMALAAGITRREHRAVEALGECLMRSRLALTALDLAMEENTPGECPDTSEPRAIVEAMVGMLVDLGAVDPMEAEL